MASIFDSSTLTVVIQENIKLNNNNYGSRTEINLGKINEVSQRIVSVPTTQTTILSMSSAVGAGTYLSSSIQYVRLTNLDNTNWVRLTFASGSKNQFDVRLDAKKSYIFTNDAYSGSASGGTFNDFASFTNLKAVASGSAVDVELFVAAT
tara:strand:- start:503 stop:952 length:450 start_codon:yes stop_codon:yes gene_type:complete